MRCGHDVLHVHDYPERKLLGDEMIAGVLPVIKIVRYACAFCDTIWRILPSFLARHLWRSWAAVEEQTIGAPPPSRPEVPARTIRRWWQRLGQAAKLLIQILATSGDALLCEIAQTAGFDCIRHDLVMAHAAAEKCRPGRILATLGALLHRLAPGIRLM